MKEIIINSWSEFQRIVSLHSYRDWMYRGQSNSLWKLESTLFRVLQKNQNISKYNNNRKEKISKEEYENEIIQKFQESSHLYLSSIPDKNKIFDWLSVMQHYGTPTRMLDFTFSPYIALFFALSNIEKDASVYCIKFKEILKIDENKYDAQYREIYSNGKKLGLEEIRRIKIMQTRDKIHETILIPFEPSFTNVRLQAQQGVFLIPNTLNYSHEEIFIDYDNDKLATKLIINIENAYMMLEALFKMNIFYTNLFPGLEGFCKSFESIGIIPKDRLERVNHY